MIIGTRNLHAKTANGTHLVEINLYLPTETTAGWECRFDIGWPEQVVVSSARGDDALHALHLAQQKIGVALHMSGYHAAGELSWTPEWVGYGFPIPKNGRDLLIGDDQKFYGLDST